MNRVEKTYDTIASEYAAQYFHELDNKPLDRKLLDMFSERVVRGGRVCEVGCGPGEIAVYLANRGINVYGLDKSERMIEEARRLSPKIQFVRGDMLAMKEPDNSLDGIVGFYAIVNLTKNEIKKALSEFHRVLKPSAPLLLSFHVGDKTEHSSEFMGKQIDLDVYFYPVDTIKTMVEKSGFHPNEIVQRSPNEAVEYPSQRAYIFAVK